jgi:hypothetical protein
MDRTADGRGQALETGTPVRVGGSVGGGSRLSLSSAADIRRFRLAHALQAIENALILLDTRPAEGVEISALERVRDDLSIVLRTIGAAR